MTEPEHDLASVRHIVDDVSAAVENYTTHLGFTPLGRHRGCRAGHMRKVWYRDVPVRYRARPGKGGV